jgi:hypothetical protein
MPRVEAQSADIVPRHFHQKAGTTRLSRLGLRRAKQHSAQSVIAVTRVDGQRIDIEAGRMPLIQRHQRAEALAQAGEFQRLAMTGQPVAEHHSGDMAAQFANQRVPQTEGLAAPCGAAGGEVDELGRSPGLSGEAGWRIPCENDQFSNAVSFALTRCAQNGLLPRSKLRGHKGPDRVSEKALADEPVTPDGAAEDADFFYARCALDKHGDGLFDEAFERR